MPNEKFGHQPPAKSVSATTVAGIALILGIVWDILFFQHLPGISVPIFWSVLLGIITYYNRSSHHHMNWREISQVGLILVLSLFYAFRASEFLMMLNGVAIMYLFLLLLANLYGVHVKKFDLPDFLVFPLVDILNGTLQNLNIFKHIVPKHGNSKRITNGILLALGVGVVFVALFASADAVVSGLLDNILTETLAEIVQHIVVIGVASAIFLLLFAPAFWKRVPSRTVNQLNATRELGLESMLVFLVLNAIFLAFLVIQAVYLFGGAENLTAFDISYSDYAREGFFQLLVVSLLVVGLVWFLRHIKHGQYVMTNKVLQAALVVQTFVVLASSWTRLGLYEQAFGFTHLRLFSHYFLIVVAIVLLLMLASLVWKISNNVMLHGIVYLFAFALIGLNVLNPDLFIAKQNVARVLDGHELDTEYLLTLSDDAAPVIGTIIRDMETSVVNQLATQAEFDEKESDIRQQIWKIDREYSDLLGTPGTETDRQNLLSEKTRLEQELRLITESQFDHSTRELRAFTRWINTDTTTAWQSWNAARVQADMIRNGLKSGALGN